MNIYMRGLSIPLLLISFESSADEINIKDTFEYIQRNLNNTVARTHYYKDITEQKTNGFVFKGNVESASVSRVVFNRNSMNEVILNVNEFHISGNEYFMTGNNGFYRDGFGSSMIELHVSEYIFNAKDISPEVLKIVSPPRPPLNENSNDLLSRIPFANTYKLILTCSNGDCISRKYKYIDVCSEREKKCFDENHYPEDEILIRKVQFNADQEVNKITIPVRDSDADRLINAFSHFIKLSGGEKDPFAN